MCHNTRAHETKEQRKETETVKNNLVQSTQQQTFPGSAVTRTQGRTTPLFLNTGYHSGKGKSLPHLFSSFQGRCKEQSSKLNRSYFLSHPYESNLDNAKGGKFSRAKASPFLTARQQGQILHWQKFAKGGIAHLCQSPTHRGSLVLQAV